MRKTFLILLSIALLITCLSSCDTEGTASEAASSEADITSEATSSEADITSEATSSEADISQLVETPAEEFEYVADYEGNVWIFAYKGSEQNIVVPKQIDGKPVVAMAQQRDATPFSETVVTIILPEGMQRIEKNAFAGCTALQSITLPESLTYMGSNAFEGCVSLKHISIPSDCWDESSTGVFSNSGLESVELAEGVSIIPKTTFANSKLKEITLPSTVKKISSQAFYGCENLETITLNHGLESIGKAAFSDSALKEISIPETVTEINEYAFDGSKKLEKVVFYGDAPEGFIKKDDPLNGYAPSTGNYIIYFNETAKGFETPKWYGYTTKIIGSNANDLPVFDNYEYLETEAEIVITRYFGQETDVVVPSQINGKNITTVGVSAFKNCESIKTIKLPDTIQIIEDRAFGNCTKLERIEFSENLRSIGIYAFTGCNALSSVTLPNSLETLGYLSFNNLLNLKEVTVGSGVKNWGRAFFASKLEKVVFAEGLTCIGDRAFDSTMIEEIVIPESVIEIGKDAFADSRLKKIYFEGNAPTLDEAGMGRKSAIVYYHEGAEGFTSPEWNGYTTEIW